jgi:hypothetical protein
MKIDIPFILRERDIPDKFSDEYSDFWKQAKYVLKNGMDINGWYAHPWLFWHSNFWKLYKDRKDGNGKIVRVLGLSDLRDNEINIANNLQKAEVEKKGLIIFGTRRSGKSIFSSSYMGYRGTIYKGSENVIAGLSHDDIKVVTGYLDLGLRSLPDYLLHSRIDDNWKSQVTLGFKDKNSNVRNEWSNFKIRNLDNGNNTEALAGITPFTLLIDEIGKGNILECLSAAIPSFETEGGWRTSVVLTGTGGNMDLGHDAMELFYNPTAYNFLAIENKEEAKVHGMFIPGTKALFVPREATKLSDFLDVKGNDLDGIVIQVANESIGRDIIKQRRIDASKSNDTKAVLKETMYHPLTSDECFLIDGGNDFPIEAVKNQLLFLESNNITGQYVELYRGIDGKVQHKFVSDLKPVSEFPVTRKTNKDAPVVIWEFPISNSPSGLYVSGCLTPNQKVLTNRGIKNVQDISFNDKLINEFGNEVDIKTLLRYDKEDEDVYTLKVSNTYRTTTFTKEHPILVSDDINNEFVFKKVKDIKVGEWIKYPKRKYNLPNLIKLLKEKDGIIYYFDELEEAENYQDFLFSQNITSNIIEKDGRYYIDLYDLEGVVIDEYFLYFKIKEITKSSYTGIVYNFECETNTFLCTHITTHNCDPYNQSASEYSDSLGTCYIYKRMVDVIGDNYQDMIVASYSARPSSIKKWHENVELLLEFYNATCMPENEAGTFIQYFSEKNKDYMLADGFSLSKAINPTTTTTSRIKGLAATRNNINYCMDRLVEYCNEEIQTGVDSVTKSPIKKLGVTRILDKMLLQEMIKYNSKGNFDRIVAIRHAIAYARSLDKLSPIVELEREDYSSNRNKSYNIHNPFFKSTGGFIKMRNPFS